MPDATLDEAIREAMASAPVGVVIYDTLELRHPAFTVPIRVVLDEVDLDARLEAGAPSDAGLIVTFRAYAFDLVPPEVFSGVPQMTLEIDNVDREIGVQLEAANREGSPITLIYRLYRSGQLATGPSNLPPMKMELKTVSVMPMRVRATAGFRDLLNRVFPGIEYSLERFPGLSQ